MSILDKITLVLGVISITSMIMSISCDRIEPLYDHADTFEMIGQIVGILCLVMLFVTLVLGG